MRFPRAFIIAAAVAVTALATVGFGKPLDSGLREDATTQPNIVITGVTADASPLSRNSEPRLGPIPCPDGTTVDFGQFCPLPTIQCADGTAVFIGQFCPVFKPAPPPQQAPPPPQQQSPPAQQAPPPPPPDTQRCRELGTC